MTCPPPVWSSSGIAAMDAILVPDDGSLPGACRRQWRWREGLRRDRARAAALGDAAGESGAQEGDDGHDEDPHVSEEDEVKGIRERKERAREGGGEGTSEALCHIDQ